MSNEIVAELIRNLAAIIAAFGDILTPLGVLFVGYWAYKSKKQSETNAVLLQSNVETLETVSSNVNGMSSNLVAATKAAATAQGQLKGRDEERAYVESALSPSDGPVKVVVVNDPE